MVTGRWLGCGVREGGRPWCGGELKDVGFEPSQAARGRRSVRGVRARASGTHRPDEGVP